VSVKAVVKPALLSWARKSAGLDTAAAAKKIGVKQQQIDNWEAGTDQPTIVQLRKAAEVYKRPLAVFYLPAPPSDVDVLHDFRKLPTGMQLTYSSELLFEIRRAYHRRKIAIELFEGLEGEVPEPLSLRASIKDDPDEVAATIREYLGISFSQQLGWKDQYQALNAWRGAIEAKNALVFQVSKIDVAEMRGFSIAAQPLPVIALNISDSPYARVFTLIHELTHILIREDGVCDLRDDQGGIEVFCNAVAGAVLVPQSWFMALPEVQNRKSQSWVDEEIHVLANRLSVSRQVLLRRLLTFKLISQSTFAAKQALYEEQAKAALAKKTNIIVTQPTKVLAASGKLFSRLVITGYQREKITGADVSDYLSMRLKHLPALEENVFG
jgi:Zn-dependent peptidase ImmA (M78 family)/DNA-binding XRE family transcriptional regulator